MDDNEFEKYRKERLAQMVSFYDMRSISNKRWYRATSVYLVVVSAGLTPTLALAPATFEWRVAESLIAASLVAVAGLLSHYKFQENWLSYRASWDALRREEQFHSARVKDYHAAQDRHALFVERAEAIFSREAAAFYARHEHEKQEQQTTKTSNPKRAKS